MRRLFRVLPLVALFAAFGLLPARAEPRGAYLLEEHIPASTLAFLSLDQLETWHARWDKTGLGRLAADEEMQAFFKPLAAQIENFAKDGMAEVPPFAIEFLKHLHGVKGQVAVALVDVDPQQEVLKAALSVDFKDSTAEFVAFLKRLKEQMDPESRQVQMETKDGRIWLTMDTGDVVVKGTVQDTTLLIATDAGLLEAMLGGAVDGSLASSGEFQKVRARCGGDDLAFFTYGNIGSALEKFGDMMPPEAQGIGGALGLDTLQSVAYGLAFKGDGFQDTMMVHAPKADHGLIPLLKMAPLANPRTLDLAPAGSFYWAEANVNFDELIPGARALVSKIDPDAVQQIDEGLEMGNQMLQVDIEKDLLGGLAGPYGAFMSFPPAGGLFPEMAVTLVVKDAAAYEQTLAKLGQGLAGLLNEDGEVLANVRDIEYHGQTLHLFELQAARGNDPIPFTPTWTVLGDRVVFTLVPYTMKEIVLRSQSAATGPTLASKPDFQALLNLKPADAGGMAYMDLKSGLSLLYGTLVPVIQTVAKPNVTKDLPVAIDWAQLPPLTRVAPYFSSLGEYITWNEDGIVVSYQGPAPMLPIFAGMAGSAVFLGMSRMMSGPGMGSSRVAIVPYGDDKDPEEDGLETEMDLELAKLQAEIFADAVARFAEVHGSLPEKLGALVDAGYVSGITQDPWGNAYRYTKTGEKAFAIASSGPDGRFGTPDDVELAR